MFVTPPRQRYGRSSDIDHPAIQAGAAEVRRLEIAAEEDRRLRIAATVIGSGPTILLVHGWGGSSADMMPLATTFALAGHRAVLLDMPGHGKSPGRESSLVEFLRAIRLVTDTLGTPDLIVGHSFGGTAAVFAMTELGLAVRAAVLVAPAPGPAYYVERFARTVGLPPERTNGMLQHVAARVGRSPESLDALATVGAVRVPGLILHDPGDREVPFEYAERLTSMWATSRLRALSRRGHKRILRDADAIAASLEFARGVLAARAPNEPLAHATHR